MRPPVVHAGVEGDALLLPEAPSVRRTLLWSERGQAAGGVRPTKAFLSGLSRKWLQPGRVASRSPSVPLAFWKAGGARNRKAAAPSNAYVRWPSPCPGQGASTSPPPRPPPRTHGAWKGRLAWAVLVLPAPACGLGQRPACAASYAVLTSAQRETDQGGQHRPRPLGTCAHAETLAGTQRPLWLRFSAPRPPPLGAELRSRLASAPSQAPRAGARPPDHRTTSGPACGAVVGLLPGGDGTPASSHRAWSSLRSARHRLHVKSHWQQQGPPLRVHSTDVIRGVTGALHPGPSPSSVWRAWGPPGTGPQRAGPHLHSAQLVPPGRARAGPVPGARDRRTPGGKSGSEWGLGAASRRLRLRSCSPRPLGWALEPPNSSAPPPHCTAAQARGNAQMLGTFTPYPAPRQ